MIIAIDEEWYEAEPEVIDYVHELESEITQLKAENKQLKEAQKDTENDKCWISVNDRLPETNTIGTAHILAYDYYEGIVKAEFFDKSANYINGSNIFQISNTSTQLYKVTHWMPLPEPPKEMCDWVDDDSLSNEDMRPDNEVI